MYSRLLYLICVVNIENIFTFRFATMKKVSDVTAFFESCVIVLILASATWKGGLGLGNGMESAVMFSGGKPTFTWTKIPTPAKICRAESIKINALRVPDILKNGTGKPAVLDCDYSLEDSKPNNGLVIKWFFNKHPAPVYQWIPNQRPQDLGVLKGKLNLDYHASNDTIKKHRALEIINPTIELSGEYECFVSTFAEETSQSKKMIIYVPEKNLALNYTKPKEDAVTFTCAADGVYPEPNMTIVASDSTHSGRTEVNTTSRDGLFDIVAAITIEDRDLESPTTFVCELRIPEANYTVKTSTTYFPGPPTTTTAPPSSQTAIDADLLATGSATSLKLSFWMLAFAISLNYLRL